MMTKLPEPKTTDDKLDVIIEYLRKMNRRDRLRMIGGFFRGLLSIIPIVFFLISMWYVYAYGDALLEKVAAVAAKQAANVARVNTGNIVDSININSLMEQFK